MLCRIADVTVDELRGAGRSQEASHCSVSQTLLTRNPEALTPSTDPQIYNASCNRECS
jgi:hypothetical protein